MKATDTDRTGQTKSRAIPVLISAVLLLVIWAYVTLTTVAPGWVHILLTAGVFLLIYGVALRDPSLPRRPRS
jgi:peptidoglycan/LPS O-acetylase OafA/YrhL